MIRETDTATGELYRLTPDEAIWWAMWMTPAGVWAGFREPKP